MTTLTFSDQVSTSLFLLLLLLLLLLFLHQHRHHLLLLHLQLSFSFSSPVYPLLSLFFTPGLVCPLSAHQGSHPHEHTRQLQWTLHGTAMLTCDTNTHLMVTTTQMIILIQFNTSEVTNSQTLILYSTKFSQILRIGQHSQNFCLSDRCNGMAFCGKICCQILPFFLFAKILCFTVHVHTCVKCGNV